MKLDLGCGLRKKEGYVGVDLIEGADIQKDMYEYLVTLLDNSVESQSGGVHQTRLGA